MINRQISLIPAEWRAGGQRRAGEVGAAMMIQVQPPGMSDPGLTSLPLSSPPPQAYFSITPSIDITHRPSSRERYMHVGRHFRGVGWIQRVSPTVQTVGFNKAQNPAGRRGKPGRRPGDSDAAPACYVCACVRLDDCVCVCVGSADAFIYIYIRSYSIHQINRYNSTHKILATIEKKKKWIYYVKKFFK